MTDHYATLSVAPDAPPEVIRAAYKVLTQKYHPDRNPARDAHACTARLNEAFQVLSDPQLREQYDTRRAALPPSQTASSALTVRPSTPTVFGSAVGHDFRLRFLRGVVLTNDLCHDARLTAAGNRASSLAACVASTARLGRVATCKQRVGVRVGGADVFVEHVGDYLPLATGQEVELVEASCPTGRVQAFIAVVNRSSHAWFWIGSKLEAGCLIRRRDMQVRDVLTYLAVVGVLSAGAWLAGVENQPAPMALLLGLMGVVTLVVIATPLLFRTALPIGAAIATAIQRVVDVPLRR